MSRKVRNSLILAKIETTVGTDAVPTPAANAILVSNQNIETNYNNIDRALIRSYFGASEHLAGTRFVQITFDVELSGSSTAGTAPAYGPLLRMCGMAETVTAGQRVEYNPITNALEAGTIYYYDDGVLHKALGCRGNIEFKAGLGERPLLSYSMIGIDGGVTASANPNGTFTAFRKPVVVTDASAGDITLGCTYATGALAGGTTYKSRGLQINLGNDVKHVALLGGEEADITGRESTGSCELMLSAAEEVAFMASINASDTVSLGFTLGTTAGNRVLIHAPAVQRINPKKIDYEGRRLIGMDLRLLPNAGNDELRLVVS
jgi:hypothetical protein